MPQNWSERCEENLLLLLGIELRFRSRPARKLGNIPTELTQ
jgi:hypothetical protein